MSEMSTASLTLAYDGEALREGRMDVRELAPALLAVGDLFRAARAVATTEEGDVHVYIKAGTPKGSFPFTLEVVQPIALQVSNWLSQHGTVISSAADLLEIVGFAGGIPIGAWEFIRRRRNRAITKTEDAGQGLVRVHIEGGDHIEVRTTVFAIASDAAFQRAVAAVVAPLAGPGVDTLEIREDPTKPGPALATSEDVAALTPTASEGLQDAEVMGEHEMTLEIVRVHFRRRHRWQLSDGSRSFGVVILDEDFLSKALDRGEIRFGKGDMLRVRLRTEQGRAGDGRLTTNYFATKVLQVFPSRRPDQARLPLPPS